MSVLSTEWDPSDDEGVRELAIASGLSPVATQTFSLLLREIVERNTGEETPALDNALDLALDLALLDNIKRAYGSDGIFMSWHAAHRMQLKNRAALLVRMEHLELTELDFRSIGISLPQLALKSRCIMEKTSRIFQEKYGSLGMSIDSTTALQMTTEYFESVDDQ